MEIKQGMTLVSKKSGKKGRIGDQFDRDHWDDFRDPEWYVHFEGGGLIILAESTLRSPDYVFNQTS